MAVYRAVIHIPRIGGNEEDETTNTLYFAGDDVDFDEIRMRISQFYGLIPSGGGVNSISDLFSYNVVSGADVGLIEFYLMPGVRGPVGAPVAFKTFTIDARPLGGQSQPSEVAVALSFHGNLGGLAESIPAGEPGPKDDIHPRARRRGRIFIGPLNTFTFGDELEGPGPQTVAAHARHTIAQAAEDFLLNHVEAEDGDQEWVVWSKTAWDAHVVVGGWVDDAHDTQRRRGEKPTTKTLFGG